MANLTGRYRKRQYFDVTPVTKDDSMTCIRAWE